MHLIAICSNDNQKDRISTWSTVSIINVRAGVVAIKLFQTTRAERRAFSIKHEYIRT